MTNFLIFLNLITLISSNSSIGFSDLINYGISDDTHFASENNIANWNDYKAYLLSQKDKDSNNDGSVSDSILNIKDYLNDNYSNYNWIRDEKNCSLTSDVSNHIPIEMQSIYFPTSDINKAITSAGVENYTSYGGCGPIASLGILDYFSRYLGYDEIISNPQNSNMRINLASEVLTNTHFSIFGDENNTLVWPWDYSNCFNKIMSNHGLSNIISSSDQWTLFGGQQENYWKQIVDNIDNGLPVTLFTGLVCGDGDFSKHYTNIYGYETWTGLCKDSNEKITKNFIKARLNWGRSSEYYCDADILNCGQLGIITYDVNYNNNYKFYAYDFAEEFVNTDNRGQYFFYTINEPVYLTNGKVLQTSRLRTSYIENQYLVLSPNRKNAGTSYLDITFPNYVSKLSFTASMWSNLEGAINEDFKIQYYDNGWMDHVNIDTYNLSTLKNYPNSFQILFS